MDDSQTKDLLENYIALIERVDGHILSIEQKYPNHIACKKGCDSCCRFLNLFPVEAFALANAFVQIPIEEQTKITKNIEKPIQKSIAKPIDEPINEPINKLDETCPLLINNSCALYKNRPVICRTHGYPIFMEKKEESYIDFCPKNFKGFTNFPKDTLISIEQLNTTLTAINQHFRKSIETDPPLPERIPISTALFLLSEQD